MLNPIRIPLRIRKIVGSYEELQILFEIIKVLEFSKQASLENYNRTISVE